MKYFLTAVLIFCSNIFNVEYCFSHCQTDSIAASFELHDLNGERFKLDENLGKKLTIILFWATWGHDSSEMMDSVEHLYQQYHDQGLKAIGICVEQQNISDSIKQKIIKFVKENRVSYPIALDNQLQTFRQYSVIAVPTTFVIDKDKKIIKHLSGFSIVGREELFEFVYEQFEGKRKPTVHKRYEKEPDKNALRNYNLAYVKFRKGNLDIAKKYANEAYQSDTLFIQPLLLLTEISIENKEIDGAGIFIDKAKKLNPNSLEVIAYEGYLKAMTGDTTAAKELLASVVQKADTFTLARGFLGYTWGVSGNLDSALNEFKRAEELDSADFRIPKLRSEIYERFGKQQEAIQDKLKAKKLRKSY